MQIIALPYPFTVCQVADEKQLNLQNEFYFVGKTRDEISLVCKTADVPSSALQREDGWRAFYLAGILDFSLVGILAKVAALLAEDGISLFALSTYNTDYILVKEASFEKALSLLAQNGYTVISE